MAFRVFLDGFELPVAPPKINTKINNQNKTFTLANMVEVNVLKLPGLTDIDFTAPLPRKHYNWRNNNNTPTEVLGKLEQLKVSGKPFQLIINRNYDTGDTGPTTNMTVSLEDYNLVDDADDFSDLSVDINFKQWTDCHAKVIYPTYDEVQKIPELSVDNIHRGPGGTHDKNPNKGKKTYTVKKGDSLWEIAKKYMGDGSRYKELYSLNKSTIDKANSKYGNSKYTIYSGQVLKLG